MTEKDFEGMAEIIAIEIQDHARSSWESLIRERIRTAYTQGQNDALTNLPKNLAFARNEAIREQIERDARIVEDHGDDPFYRKDFQKELAAAIMAQGRK